MINSTNSEYAITHESELAYVLSKFNPDFIFTTISESLNTRLRSYGYTIPNIVNAYEQNFLTIKGDYPNSSGDIIDVRNETYSNIIKQLCDFYQLEYDDHDSLDIFTPASILYSFLVSDFQSNIVNFFVNFIIKEKNELYTSLGLSEKKKNKDAGTAYSKRVFKDPKLGIISANLEYVIDNICNGFDIDLNTYLSIVYINTKDMYDLLSTSIKPVNNFFKTYIVSALQGEYRSIILTSIRLRLQTILFAQEGIGAPEIFDSISEGV